MVELSISAEAHGHAVQDPSKEKQVVESGQVPLKEKQVVESSNLSEALGHAVQGPLKEKHVVASKLAEVDAAAIENDESDLSLPNPMWRGL